VELLKRANVVKPDDPAAPMKLAVEYMQIRELESVKKAFPFRPPAVCDFTLDRGAGALEKARMMKSLRSMKRI